MKPTLEIRKHGRRFWAVFLHSELLCVTVYKKGALAVIAALPMTKPFTPSRS